MKYKGILFIYLLRVYRSILIAFLTSLAYWLYPLNYLAFSFLIWYENLLAKINNLINKSKWL